MGTGGRITDAERREAILGAAVAEIAISGFERATTAGIARRAGVSESHIFRLFGSKRELGLAVIDRCAIRIVAGWEQAVSEADETRLETLGRAYLESLSEHRAELMVHLQAYASAQDPDLAAAIRGHFVRIYRYLARLLERDGDPRAYEEAGAFLGRGLLVNAAMAVGLESVLTPEEWAGICHRSGVALVENRLERVAS